ncbi:hypothetical protein CYR55_05560 [Chimaeribacter californicus]|uniref:Uncharacterized protein n=2 Tax=Chimaeribacter californicus TaxID=2060067 RepID=A0A2N5EE10_9GAMM|nr:hypothetical protein CYR55_05560 [Chimaeribacter californicus]
MSQPGKNISGEDNMANNDEQERERFEAWWDAEYKHLESSKYTDAVPHIKYGFWQAWLARSKQGD